MLLLDNDVGEPGKDSVQTKTPVTCVLEFDGKVKKHGDYTLAIKRCLLFMSMFSASRSARCFQFQ